MLSTGLPAQKFNGDKYGMIQIHGMCCIENILGKRTHYPLTGRTNDPLPLALLLSTLFRLHGGDESKWTREYSPLRLCLLQLSGTGVAHISCLIKITLPDIRNAYSASPSCSK